MDGIMLLPLEIIEQIALCDPYVYHTLALAIRNFGLYTLDDTVQLRVKAHFTICKQTVQHLHSNNISTNIIHTLLGKFHRDNGAACIYYLNGQLSEEYWYKHGKRHREDGPAEIEWEDGQIVRETWKINGKYSISHDHPMERTYKNNKIDSEHWFTQRGYSEVIYYDKNGVIVIKDWLIGFNRRYKRCTYENGVIKRKEWFNNSISYKDGIYASDTI